MALNKSSFNTLDSLWKRTLWIFVSILLFTEIPVYRFANSSCFLKLDFAKSRVREKPAAIKMDLPFRFPPEPTTANPSVARKDRSIPITGTAAERHAFTDSNWEFEGDRQ